MPKQSAGLLIHRRTKAGLEVFLVHPGGPFWSKKDAGAWSIPKGEFGETEEPLSAAIRELREETGFTVSEPFVALGTIRQAGGKTVHAFAVQAELDPARIISDTFELEWPPRCGKMTRFPEVDRAAWFPIEIAKTRINPAQAEFLARLEQQAR